MSSPYSATILPDVVSVRCPECAHHARFEYASYMPIRERKFIDYFKQSDHFTYIDQRDWYVGMPHVAVYFHGLKGNSLHAINDLPEPFDTAQWEQHRSWTTDRMYRYYDHGVVVCSGCGLRRKHQLDWPADAWFQITYRQQTLWAFDRASAANLRHFIAANDRSLKHFTHHKFLMKIPAHFLDAKARNSVVKKLDALLKA